MVTVSPTLALTMLGEYDEPDIPIVCVVANTEAVKKHKRAKVFDEWFMANETGECFSKHNEEIVVNELTGEEGVTLQDLEYLSLIIKCSNLDSEIVLEEFQQIKQALIAGK